jgi:hypothetical protein
MEHPKVARLYKYAALSGHAISSIESGKLWFPYPSTFNDPFDCSVINYAQDYFDKQDRLARRDLRVPTPAAGRGDLTHRTLRKLRKTFLASETRRNLTLAEKFQQATAATQAFLHGFGVLCLTETPRSILMWSHYGGQHTGICMEFARSPENLLGTDARPVKYVSRRTITNASNPVFEKYTGWQYEREWRLLANEGNRLYPRPGQLLSVICGARMPEANIDAVHSVIASINSSGPTKVSVKYAVMHPSRYLIAVKSKRQELKVS